MQDDNQLKNMNQLRTGFIAPKIEEDHFRLGGISLGGEVIKVDGNWFRELPDFESQLQKTFDSDGCVVYATLNAIETFEKFITKKEPNYSDRFIYNVVGITPPGSDPHLVATTIRGSGLIPETDLPDEVDSLATFMTPRPPTTDLIVKGKQWFQKWMPVGHEWVITPSTKTEDKIRLLKEALLRGTVCISVCAWFQDSDGLYYSPENMENEHWTMLYNIDETGLYVFDSYLDAKTGSFLKKLRLDHNIMYAKRYSLTPVDTSAKKNWLVDIIKSLWELVFQLEKTKQLVEELPKPRVEVPKYDWSNKEAIRHSIRVIADEEGLTLLQKDLACDIASCESGFNINAKLVNSTTSIDRGLFQINNKYHPEATDELAFNPEWNTRWACGFIKKNQNLWPASQFCWNKTGKYNVLL